MSAKVLLLIKLLGIFSFTQLPLQHSVPFGMKSRFCLNYFLTFLSYYSRHILHLFLVKGGFNH